MLIDDLLGRGTIGNTAADSGEVLGGDTEAIGIKRYLTLRETVFMNECDELFEKFVLAVVTFHIVAGKETMNFIIHIEQKALQVIAGYLIAASSNRLILAVNSSGSVKQGFSFRK